MSGALRSLEEITAMVLDAELARLRQLSDELALLRAEAAELAARARARRETLAADGPDLAFGTGRDALWLGWIARERARLNSEIAQLAARREAQRLIARTAFGRVEAIRGLERRAIDVRRLEQMRKLMNEA